MKYRVEVRGPWCDDDWRPVFEGGFCSGRTASDRSTFDTRKEAKRQMAIACHLGAGFPFEFRIVKVDDQRPPARST